MQLKNIGIMASVIIGIVIIGTMLAMTNTVQTNIDEYAVDADTVNILLENSKRVMVVDIRTAEQYQSGHLLGASHDVYDSATMEKRVKTMQSRIPDVASTYNMILIDEDGTRAKQAALTMTEMGIHTFYLDGGMSNVPETVVSDSKTVIDSEELMQRLASDDDLYLLDVRQPDELLKSKIDGSVNVPLAEIFQPNGMDDIPTDKPVIVVCASGNRATIASYALAQEGIDFQVLEGGINSWNSQVAENMGL